MHVSVHPYQESEDETCKDADASQGGSVLLMDFMIAGSVRQMLLVNNLDDLGNVVPRDGK